jgi:hypothetical protein
MTKQSARIRAKLMNGVGNRVSNTERQLALQFVAMPLNIIAHNKPNAVIVRPRTSKGPTVGSNSRQCRFDSIVNGGLPRAEVIKLPAGASKGLTFVTLRVRQIGEVRVLQEMNRTQFTVAPVVFLGRPY